MRNDALILMCLLVCSFTSCKKNVSLPTAAGATLAKIVPVGPGGPTSGTEVFTYDSQNRLTKINFLDSAGNVIPNNGQTFTYDNTGRCSGSIIIETQFSISYPIDTLTFSFTYDNNGNIVKEIRNSTTPSTFGPAKFTYNADGWLIADSSYDNSGAITVYSNYSYDANGNVTSYEPFTLYQGSFIDLSGGPTTFEYDKNVNPYNKIGKLLFVTSDPYNCFYLSKANIVTTAAYGTAATIANYTYFNNGLPRTAYYGNTKFGYSFYYQAP